MEVSGATIWGLAICFGPNPGILFPRQTLSLGGLNFEPTRPKRQFERPLTHFGRLGEPLDAPKKPIPCKNHQKHIIKLTIRQDTCKNTWVLATYVSLPMKK